MISNFEFASTISLEQKRKLQIHGNTQMEKFSELVKTSNVLSNNYKSYQVLKKCWIYVITHMRVGNCVTITKDKYQRVKNFMHMAHTSEIILQT